MTPTLGRIVHYNKNGTYVPAIVVAVGEISLSLQVFSDTHDGSDFHALVIEGTELGTWKWPTRA